MIEYSATMDIMNWKRKDLGHCTNDCWWKVPKVVSEPVKCERRGIWLLKRSTCAAVLTSIGQVGKREAGLVDISSSGSQAYYYLQTANKARRVVADLDLAFTPTFLLNQQHLPVVYQVTIMMTKVSATPAKYCPPVCQYTYRKLRIWRLLIQVFLMVNNVWKQYFVQSE